MKQQYDTALKSLFGDEAAAIIACIVPEAECIGELNVEIDRTTLKADLVYNIRRRGKLLILHMELQTDADSEMELRMLKYHVGLYDKHRLPVISMVIYPFETSIPSSPFQEDSGDEVLLTFHYKVLPLWKLDAEPFVRDHVVCMYALLPAMKGVNAPMLVRAIEEMRQHYNNAKLADHLVRFRLVLQRSKSISEYDKRIVEEKLRMYDSLVDGSPFIQQREAKGRAEGRTEGMSQGAQEMVMALVEERFPALMELAQQRVLSVKDTVVLKKLLKKIATTPDEDGARLALTTISS